MRPALHATGADWPGGQPPHPESGAWDGLVCSEAGRPGPRALLGSTALRKNLQAIRALPPGSPASQALPRLFHVATMSLAFLVPGGCAEPMAPAHGCRGMAV